MTPEQCKAARALAGISQQTLAIESGVSKRTIASFESGTRETQPRTVRDLRDALMEGHRVAILPDGSIKQYTPDEVAALERVKAAG